MQITSFSETWVTPLLRRWWLVVLFGLALAVVGVILLLNPFAAARTLAVLLAIALALTAVGELNQVERHQARWPSYALAGVWTAAAVVALVWPDVTLWALAVTIGVALVVGGLIEITAAWNSRRDLPNAGLWWLDGALSIAVGIAALVWPTATVVVLAVLFGIRVLLRGCVTILFGLGLRRLARMTAPYVPT